MTAPKRKPVRPAPRTVRQFVHDRPWVSWGTLAAVVAVVGGLGSFTLWIVDHIETKREADEHAAKDDSRADWTTYGIQKLTVLTLRNRVNDCRVMAKPSPMEKVVCQQYEEEYNEGARSAEAMHAAAMASTKAKP